jgi:hypothetical protein
LAVDVTAYCDGGVDRDDIAFFDEQFSRFVAEFSDLGFGDWSTGAELRYGSTWVLSVLLLEQATCLLKSYLSRSLILSKKDF